MEDREILVKTIRKKFTDKIKAGVTWFTFITTINDIKLTQRELQLMAFINSRGTISSTSAKEEFCKLFDSSPATVSNMVSKLMSLKLLVKEKSKTKINQSLRVDFDKDFIVRFYIGVREEKEGKESREFPEEAEAK